MSWLEALMLLLLVAVPWGQGGAVPWALFIVHSAVFAAAGIVLLRSLRRGQLSLRLTWAHLAYLPFLTVGVVSFLRSEYLFASFETVWDQFAWYLLALALAAAVPSASFSRLAEGAVTAAALAQAVPAIYTRWEQGVAISPSFLNANHTAAYLNVAAFIALGRGGWLPGFRHGREDGRGRAIAWRLAGLICVAGMVAIASRGALLAFGLVLAGAFWWSGGAKPARLRIAVPLGAVLVIAAALSIHMRFATTSDPYRYLRPKLWEAAVSAWRDAPVLGIGPGMYDHRAVRYNFPLDGMPFRYSKQPHSAHSQPIQILAEEGITGLLAMLLFAGVAAGGLASAARRGKRGSGSARAVMLGACAVAVHALVETPFEAPALPVTLLVLAWPVLHPGGPGEEAAGVCWPWPAKQARASRRAALVSCAAMVAVIYVAGTAAPYFSYLAAAYAESPGRPAVRIDEAARLSEALNPWQPFLEFRRARAALRRVPRLSPALLANATESLTRTTWLEPGDPSAYLLLGRLYARASAEMPGAGPGALERAERSYTDAIGASPLDARLWAERAAFRLSEADLRGALADCARAIDLEPNAVPALQIRLEALLEGGRKEAAARALSQLDRALGRLRGYEPLNRYEEDLVRLDVPALARARKELEG